MELLPGFILGMIAMCLIFIVGMRYDNWLHSRS